jgi:hypothetical protein
VLLWFLHGQIAFTNFDNPLFLSFLRSVDIKDNEFGSAKTIVSSLLPAIYSYVTEEMCRFLHSCAAVSNSWDAWSRFGDKFISQHYHAINPKSFEYRAYLLDLVPYSGPQFAEALAGGLSERREHWLGGSNVLAAAGIADGEAKGQAAGAIMFGDADMLKCQNHRLKSAYTEAEENSGQFKADLLAFAALASSAAHKGPTCTALWSHQRLHGLPELVLLFYIRFLPVLSRASGRSPPGHLIPT